MEIITYIIRTLETIEVKGSDNMSKMLGCIAALKDMQERSKKEQEEITPEVKEVTEDG